MELIALGTDGGFPRPGGACSGYLVREDGFTLWLDAGGGTLARLQELASVDEIGAVCLSHTHLDHCADLALLFVALWFHPARPRGLPVYAPPDADEFFGRLMSDGARDIFFEVFDWHTIAPGERAEVGPFQLRAFESAHSRPNNTMRISSGGKSLCYSGDTGPNPGLVRAAEAADLFLCEATWQEADRAVDPIHLRAAEAGRAGRDAGCASLALTHVWPTHDPAVSFAEAAGQFAGPIDIAREVGRWTV